jgi:hypothetical protein
MIKNDIANDKKVTYQTYYNSQRVGDNELFENAAT